MLEGAWFNLWKDREAGLGLKRLGGVALEAGASVRVQEVEQVKLLGRRQCRAARDVMGLERGSPEQMMGMMELEKPGHLWGRLQMGRSETGKVQWSGSVR